MKTRIAIGALGMLLVGAAHIARAEETVESIEKKVIEATSEITSIKAKVAMDGNMQQMGRKVAMEGGGTFEAEITEDKEKSRTEMDVKVTIGEGESAMKMDSSSLSIVDGDIAYVLQEQMGQKMAMKMKAESASSPTVGGKRMFASLREKNDLRVLPDSKVNGRPTFVIEATPNEQNAQMPIKNMLVYIDKELGMTVKTVVNNTSGEPMQAITLSDIEVNPDIDPSRFVFKAPEGVTVMDRTQM